MATNGAADLTGRVLAGRYRLLGAIGAGASGRVYVADDVRLKRRVGVKVLHLALAEDAGFLRRFRAEAQVAASLNHPNVMSVYDWGEDDVPFMVLELLTGGSLRGLLDTGARLSPSQAAHVGRQVSGALEYAHARGVVHRDIKPANLLFDEHGIVRVADFGLARALAEASWTEPAGAVVGTARYAAPEQATGAPLDGRADLYSLAVVLVEGVTGTVPAVADTAIGTLAARTHTPLVAPIEMGRLGPVVERAGRPDPAERYPDAATMRAALSDVARVLPPPQPLTLAGLGGEIDGGDPTQIGRSSNLFDQDAPEPDPEVETAPKRAVRVERVRTPGSYRWVPVVVLVAILVALIGGGAALAAGAGGGTVAVPSLVGLKSDTATAKVTQLGLSLKITERAGRRPEGHRDRTAPRAGVVRGRERIGGADRVARSAAGRRPDRGRSGAGRCAGDARAGSVRGRRETPVRRDRAGRRGDRHRPRGRHQGAARLHGAAARERRAGAGDRPGPRRQVVRRGVPGARRARVHRRACSDDFDATIATGKVIGTDPAANQAIPRGAPVTVHVSKGPEMVKVPSLVGLSLDTATQMLQSQGFQVDTQSYLPGRLVRAQDPAAGASVNKGTKVTLFF